MPRPPDCSHPITALKAFKNDFISELVPIVTRRKLGRAGKGRPTSTPRLASAAMIDGTVGVEACEQLLEGPHFDERSIIMKFACDGI